MDPSHQPRRRYRDSGAYAAPLPQVTYESFSIIIGKVEILLEGDCVTVRHVKNPEGIKFERDIELYFHRGLGYAIPAYTPSKEVMALAIESEVNKRVIQVKVSHKEFEGEEYCEDMVVISLLSSNDTTNRIRFNCRFHSGITWQLSNGSTELSADGDCERVTIIK